MVAKKTKVKAKPKAVKKVKTKAKVAAVSKKKKQPNFLSFQEIIFKLQKFWSDQGCVILCLQPLSLLS